MTTNPSTGLPEELEKIPIISLWMPWANWVMLGWKEIETRLHKRLYGLEGKVVGIHATLKWDETALEQTCDYLEDWQIAQTKEFLRIGGAILGTACVTKARELTAEDSHRALINCGSVKRHGLVLAYPKVIPAIPCRGKQGIWYHEIPCAASVLREGTVEKCKSGRDPDALRLPPDRERVFSSPMEFLNHHSKTGGNR